MSESIKIDGIEFACVDSESIEGFLKRHPFLIRTIGKIPYKIEEYFGESVEIIIEPEYHPVDDEMVEKLWILVKTNQSYTKAHKKLKKLDQLWWIDMSRRCRQYVDIDIY